MTTSSYLKRPIRKYEDALSDVEKARKVERHAAAAAKQRKRVAQRHRPAA
ncbi:MAG: hypothetical protein IID51_03360 [Proteobacteria bacterium]|nr:hypothetical protein [Pseudomonadota bacterium]